MGARGCVEAMVTNIITLTSIVLLDPKAKKVLLFEQTHDGIDRVLVNSRAVTQGSVVMGGTHIEEDLDLLHGWQLFLVGLEPGLQALKDTLKHVSVLGVDVLDVVDDALDMELGGTGVGSGLNPAAPFKALVCL